MGLAPQFLSTPSVAGLLRAHAGRPPETFRFQSLVLSEPASRSRSLATTLATSMALHTVLIGAVALLPILLYEGMPEPGGTVRAFFVTPVDMAPPPPPPPPPPAAVAHPVPAVVPRPQSIETPRFMAPIEIPDQIKPEPGFDLGVEGGVPGGVEGGVPGGVLGGVVGGLALVPPPPPARVVRVGGAIVAPRLIKKVTPEYPPLASAARITGVVIIEAHVDVDGYVKTVTTLRGAPLLEESALAAVRQWRYKPLLLNGEPTEFIVTVTLVFNLVGPAPQVEHQ
jgi:periplasmic protein TonB